MYFKGNSRQCGQVGHKDAQYIRKRNANNQKCGGNGGVVATEEADRMWQGQTVTSSYASGASMRKGHPAPLKHHGEDGSQVQNAPLLQCLSVTFY